MFKKRGTKSNSKTKTREKDHDSNDEEVDHTLVIPKAKNSQNRKMQISSKETKPKSNTLSFEDDITPVNNIKKVEKHDTYVEYIRKGTFSDKKEAYNSQRSSAGEYSEEKIKELAAQQNKGRLIEPEQPIEVMEIESDDNNDGADEEVEKDKVFTGENRNDIELTEEEAENELERQEEINEKLDKHSKHTDLQIERAKRMKELSKRKNIIRTNDLLKDRKEEIREKIEKYGSNSSGNSDDDDDNESSSSEDEFKKFEREQILRGTSLVPNSEMISKEEMQQEVKQLIKSKIKEISIDRVMDTMKLDIENCKTHITEDKRAVMLLNEGILSKNQELEQLKNEFTQLDIRNENIEKFNQYISQLSSCLSNKAIKINEIYENYKTILLNYSKAVKYKKFFDIYDKIQEFELENKSGINSEYFSTLLKDIENNNVLGDFNIEKDYFSQKAIRDFNRQLNNNLELKYNNLLKEKIENIKQNHDVVFSDILVEYCNLQKIIKRFKEFYYHSTEEYKNVYASLALAEYIIPILTHEIVFIDPGNMFINTQFNFSIYNQIPIEEITEILIKEYINDGEERKIIIQSILEKLYTPFINYILQNDIVELLDSNKNKSILFNIKSIVGSYDDIVLPNYIVELKNILCESIKNNVNQIIIPCIEMKNKNNEKLNEIIEFIKVQIDYSFECMKQIQPYTSILGKSNLEESFNVLKEKIVNSLQSLIDITENDEYKRIREEVKSFKL